MPIDACLRRSSRAFTVNSTFTGYNAVLETKVWYYSVLTIRESDSKCSKTKKIGLPSSLKKPCNDSQIIRCFLCTFFVEFFGSCVTCTCTVGIRGVVSITTQDEHLDWCLINIAIDAQSTLNRILDQQSVDGLSSVERFICIHRKLVDSQETVNRVVDRVSINWVSIVSIEGMDRGYMNQSRVLIMGIDWHSTAELPYMYVHIIVVFCFSCLIYQTPPTGLVPIYLLAYAHFYHQLLTLLGNIYTFQF